MNKYYNIKIFTLIELMVILSVIMTLTALLVPSLDMARTKLAKIECTNNLEQTGVLFSSYSIDHNGSIPAPHINQYGNYWSNILYSLYISDEGLEFISTGVNDRTAEPAPNYVDKLGYTYYRGLDHIEGTIFHCPSSLNFTRLDNGFVSTKPISYSMNPYLAYGKPSTGKPWLPVRLSNIARPSEAYQVMDNNTHNYIGVWTFWGYSTKTLETNIHDTGRNILYSDGHVNYLDNMDIPPNVVGEREPFWFGL